MMRVHSDALFVRNHMLVLGCFTQDFYEDIFEEVDKYGEVEHLNVCDNLADHMVGNVYIKFKCAPLHYHSVLKRDTMMNPQLMPHACCCACTSSLCSFNKARACSASVLCEVLPCARQVRFQWRGASHTRNFMFIWAACEVEITTCACIQTCCSPLITAARRDEDAAARALQGLSGALLRGAADPGGVQRPLRTSGRPPAGSTRRTPARAAVIATSCTCAPSPSAPAAPPQPPAAMRGMRACHLASTSKATLFY